LEDKNVVCKVGSELRKACLDLAPFERNRVNGLPETPLTGNEESLFFVEALSQE